MGIFRIAIPVQGTYKQIERTLGRLPKEADFVEIWLDALAQEFRRRPAHSVTERLKKLIALAKRPVIVTCKSPEEQGVFGGTPQERMALLGMALRLGAAYVDIPLSTRKNLIADLRKGSRGKRKGAIIFSYHNFQKTPSLAELMRIISSARRLAKRGDTIKIAVMVKQWADNATLFQLTRTVAPQLKKGGVALICLGMGEKGKISRIACPLLGSTFTFVALNERTKTAPGQMTLGELKEIGVLSS